MRSFLSGLSLSWKTLPKLDGVKVKRRVGFGLGAVYSNRVTKHFHQALLEVKVYRIWYIDVPDEKRVKKENHENFGNFFHILWFVHVQNIPITKYLTWITKIVLPQLREKFVGIDLLLSLKKQRKNFYRLFFFFFYSKNFESPPQQNLSTLLTLGNFIFSFRNNYCQLFSEIF